MIVAVTVMVDAEASEAKPLMLAAEP